MSEEELCFYLMAQKMIRSIITTLVFAAFAMASIGVAQEKTTNPTDILFEEILNEVNQNQRKDKPKQSTPTQVPIRNKAQTAPTHPAGSNLKVGPVVSQDNWGANQKPIFTTPNQTQPNNHRLPGQQVGSKTPSTSIPPGNVRSISGACSVDLIAPTDINLNQKATIRVQLKNAGIDALRNMEFIATLPEHVRFVAARPQPTKTVDGRLEFSKIQLAAQRQTFIEIDVVPTAKAPMNIGTQIRYANQSQIAINVRQPILDIQVAGPEQMILGETKEYVITVANRGDGVANNLRFTSEFPAGLQKLRSSNTMIERLEPGKTAQVRVTAQSLESGNKKIQFKLASTELEPVSRETPVVILQPEIQVLATGPSVNFLRRDGIYQIDINNPGKVDCNEVSVELAIPAEMNVSTISRRADYNEATRQLTWKFKQIPAGQKEMIQFKAQCTEEGQHSCGIIVRSNETIAKEFRLNTMVATRPDVSINITGESGPVQIGRATRFDILVENSGSRSAENVEVSVKLPVHLAPAVSEHYKINQYDNVILFSATELKPGEKKSFQFTAVGSAQGEHVVRSILNMAGSKREIIAEDSVYFFEPDQSKVGQKLEPQIRRR